MQRTRGFFLRLVASAAFLAALRALPPAAAMDFPGPAPGRPLATLSDNRLTLENDVLSVAWDVGPGRRVLVEAADRLGGRTVRARGGELFTITLADGRVLRASEMETIAAPAIREIYVKPDTVRAAIGFDAKQVLVFLKSPDGDLSIEWRATLRNDANCVIQEVELHAKDKEVAVKEVTLLDAEAAKAHAVGEVDGSPVVAGRMFFACEHPMAANRVRSGRITCSLACHRPVDAQQPWTASAVIGAVPEGQLRRGFLYYLERQRARPYRLFVHYNSWWDIAWPDRKMDETKCLAVIEAFGRELTEKRGVQLDSFCFDDGWDDNRTLWRFHDGFPRGFTPLRTAAEKYGSHLGVWLSPWGGYGHAKKERMKYGATQGFETNDRGFSLAGPNYYSRFRDACAGMIRDYDVNYFKFDGIAAGIGSQGAGNQYATDVDALLRLVADLRRQRPELFVNITTGTWPSPYWLWWGRLDLAERAGRRVPRRRQRAAAVDHVPRHDHLPDGRPPWAAVPGQLADDRQRLLRRAGDGRQVQQRRARPGRRTPHGAGRRNAVLRVVRHARHAETGGLGRPGRRDRLGPGPTATCWSTPTSSAADPGDGQPYGYASWSPRKGILALRNPGPKPATPHAGRGRGV